MSFVLSCVNSVSLAINGNPRPVWNSHDGCQLWLQLGWWNVGVLTVSVYILRCTYLNVTCLCWEYCTVLPKAKLKFCAMDSSTFAFIYVWTFCVPVWNPVSYSVLSGNMTVNGLFCTDLGYHPHLQDGSFPHALRLVHSWHELPLLIAAEAIDSYLGLRFYFQSSSHSPKYTFSAVISTVAPVMPIQMVIAVC